MRRHLIFVGLLIGCSASTRERDGATPADSAFVAVQARGAETMGVDQYTSSHIFEDLADGGRIVLQRDSADSAGTRVIRAHLADIARRFAAGDFTIPGRVHAQVVPGTDLMAARRAMLRYAVDTLPRGGQVRITTTDSVALAAVRTFLSFQRMDHRTAGHDH